MRASLPRNNNKLKSTSKQLSSVRIHESVDLRTNKAVRVKKYEWEGRHKREGNSTSSKVGVKEYQGYEDMKTKTKKRIQEYKSRPTNKGKNRYECGDTGMSIRASVIGYQEY